MKSTISNILQKLRDRNVTTKGPMGIDRLVNESDLSFLEYLADETLETIIDSIVPFETDTLAGFKKRLDNLCLLNLAPRISYDENTPTLILTHNAIVRYSKEDGVFYMDYCTGVRRKNSLYGLPEEYRNGTLLYMNLISCCIDLPFFRHLLRTHSAVIDEYIAACCNKCNVPNPVTFEQTYALIEESPSIIDESVVTMTIPYSTNYDTARVVFYQSRYVCLYLCKDDIGYRYGIKLPKTVKQLKHSVALAYTIFLMNIMGITVYCSGTEVWDLDLKQLPKRFSNEHVQFSVFDVFEEYNFRF